MDYDSLSNPELIQALTERGINVGGINASTRNLYINKLKKLVNEEQESPVSEINGGGDHLVFNQEEDDGEVPVVLNNVYPSLDATPRQRVSKRQSATPAPRDEDSDYGEETSRMLSDEELRNIREESYYRRTPPREGASMISNLFKVLIIVLIACFVYFLTDNMIKGGNRETI